MMQFGLKFLKNQINILRAMILFILQMRELYQASQPQTVKSGWGSKPVVAQQPAKSLMQIQQEEARKLQQAAAANQKKNNAVRIWL